MRPLPPAAFPPAAQIINADTGPVTSVSAVATWRIADPGSGHATGNNPGNISHRLFPSFSVPETLTRRATAAQRNAVANTLGEFKSIPDGLKNCLFDIRSNQGQYVFPVRLPGADGVAITVTACLQFRLRSLRNRHYGLDLQAISWQPAVTGALRPPPPVGVPAPATATLPRVELDDYRPVAPLIDMPVGTGKRKRGALEQGLATQYATAVAGGAGTQPEPGDLSGAVKRQKTATETAAETTAPVATSAAGRAATAVSPSAIPTAGQDFTERVLAIPVDADADALFANVTGHLREALHKRDRSRHTVVLIGTRHDSRTGTATEHAVLTALCEEWPAEGERRLFVEWSPSKFEAFKPVRQAFDAILDGGKGSVDAFSLDYFAHQKPELADLLAKEAVVMRHATYLDYEITPVDRARDEIDYPALEKPAQRAMRDRLMLDGVTNKKGGPGEVSAFIFGTGHFEFMQENLRALDVNVIGLAHVPFADVQRFVPCIPYLLEDAGTKLIRDANPAIDGRPFDARAYRNRCDAMLAGQFMSSLDTLPALRARASELAGAATAWRREDMALASGGSLEAARKVGAAFGDLSSHFSAAFADYERRMRNLEPLLDHARLTQHERTTALPILDEVDTQISAAFEQAIEQLFLHDPDSARASREKLHAINDHVLALTERVEEADGSNTPPPGA